MSPAPEFRYTEAIPETQTKTCQNCQTEFRIEPEDFVFYERMDVPPPARCPDCRQQRRYAWRNERIFYRRSCDLCGKSTVTIYSPNKPFKVYCPPCWWSDNWTALDYGRDFDFSRPFFPQWKELQLQVPRIALLTKNSVNSEYTNHSNNNKNCYLCAGTFDSENVLYSTDIEQASRDSMDCHHIVRGAELSYECIDSERIYGCQYGMMLRDCTNCYYSYDCRGCSDCFLCFNLRKKQYCILNQQYSKEEYFKKLEEFRLGSFEERQKLYGQWLDLMQKSLHPFAIIEKSVDVSGNTISNSKNAHDVFQVDMIENARRVIACVESKDLMDSYKFGFKCELIYESHGTIHSYNMKFTHLCYDNSHLEYCDMCQNSENLFGCVGIKKGSYCIFNKRYNEKEYGDLKAKIIAHMRETGEYGEFFPPELSPIAYNETQGQVHMPLTREEVERRGWQWEEATPGTFGKETMRAEDLPDSIEDVQDSILKEILACTKCGRNYNIVEPELALYRRFQMPLPRLCHECRYRARVAIRTPRRLWDRQCMCDYVVRKNEGKHAHHPEVPCPNKFETAYAPGRSEVIYCEQCYQAEVA